jgi:hypothetical protein
MIANKNRSKLLSRNVPIESCLYYLEDDANGKLVARTMAKDSDPVPLTKGDCLFMTCDYTPEQSVEA